ncbi:serine/threonine-protein kinase [Catenulispora subtropica]|uniref:non-specific serine/threonine protein kinase n=1 Tax=Catenulispora subtropica TaxID=450798 RepID=A0ABN2SQN0_9ACTN
MGAGAGRPQLDIPLRLTAGSVVAGRYRVGERVGAGAASEVFAAVDQTAERQVAVKVLREGIGEVLRQRFLEETRILSGLEHPHLLPLLDAGVDGGLPFLVMPLVEGTSLEQVAGPKPPDWVRRVGAAVADALAYIHARGIVHRDITPGNVLLDRDEHVFLTDFGIAKAWDGPALTAENFVAGTAGYLAPEQAEGRGASSASDVYALGLVLLETLTGVREYSGTPFERAVAAATRSPRVPPALGAPWCTVLRRMTARDRRRRPTVDEVRALLHGRTPPAVPVAEARRTVAVAVPLAEHLGLAG